MPFIINDKEFLKRRKTFENFTKSAFLDLYEVHLKRMKGMSNLISEKADYKEVITKTTNNRKQEDLLKSLKKHNN